MFVCFVLLRLVCDSWLELCTENSAEEAEELLSRVIKLRETWQLLIELKLKGTQVEIKQ